MNALPDGIADLVRVVDKIDAAAGLHPHSLYAGPPVSHHTSAIKRRPPRRSRNVQLYVVGSCLMLAQIALAIAILVHFSLTAVQTATVVVLGFLVPVLAVWLELKVGISGGREASGFIVALCMFFSVVSIISLVIFGSVTLGS